LKEFTTLVNITDKLVIMGRMQTDYPLTSAGMPDSCAYLDDFHFCDIRILNQMIQ